MKIEETYLPPSRAEMAARVASLQSAMDRNGLEAYVSVATANILWLTNFANFVHERPFILVVPRSGAPKFVVPFLELDHVNHRVVGDVEFVPYREFPAPCGQRWQDRFADILPVQGGIGIEEMLPQALVGEIGPRARPLDLIDTLREIKSDYEISRIAYGCRLMSEAHAELLRAARPGLSQSEINRSIGRDIHAKMVADNPALNPFATSIMTLIQNPSVSHDPHNFTDLDMHMVNGGPHVTVFNSVLNGYGAEIERTFFLGAVPDDAKRPFEAMMEARRIVFEKTRAGAILEDIDREVNAFFNANGYEEARRHRAGHGMGVTAHEGPFIAEGDRREVRPGMVFTIEPGIYLRGVGGFRHSDTVLVTEDSLECLTFGPDQLEALIL